MIARLFAIEAGIKGKPPAERLAARHAKATPILAELRAFLDATMGKVSGKSSLAGAFRYATSRWTALTRYVGDGRLEMSTDGADKRESSARRGGHGQSSLWLFLPRRHHSLVGLLSTPHVVGFPLADLLDPIVPTWSRLAILARSAGFERCFA
jgi:Transposase IS66 family